MVFANGRVKIGGDVSASFGSKDPGFFNYTDYEHSALRAVRVNITAEIKANDHFTFLGDLQTENVDTITPYALYLRIRPWTTRDLDIQVGRIPPTFGAFSRRTYATDNPLIGYPLAYQYFTSIRPDALPASIAELLQKKGNGWLVKYSVGAPYADHGVPIMTAFRWDTGVQVHASWFADQKLSATASVTSGTLSNPLVRDDNGGKQIAGRLEWRPVAALTLGTSAARGGFVGDDAAAAAGAGTRGGLTQTAWGADAEYSRDHLLVRFETIRSAWTIPFLAQPTMTDALTALSASLEGRYTLAPGFYVAARADHLGFNDVTLPTGPTSWDAPVSRVETGGGYSLQRNLILKVTYQHDTRHGGRLASTANLVATQVVLWF